MSRISAAVKAHTTGRWAETMFRAMSRRVAKRWQFISFRGQLSGEWRGVVDLIAIRKDTSAPVTSTLKRGDLFEIILIQVKGGSARSPTTDDVRRLKLVAKHYKARAIVLFEWRRQVTCRFRVLTRLSTWEDKSPDEIFR